MKKPRTAAARGAAVKTSRRGRAVQRTIERTDRARRSGVAKGPMQAGARLYPAPPLPGQHLRKPGLERDLVLAPLYEAPEYKGSGKLLGMVALITGGDSGIGRAVAVLYARAAVPAMTNGGAIVMTGSVTGLLGSKALLDYSMTKGGIHAFTRSLAAQLVERGIRVNAVAPGPVWTPLNPAVRPAKTVAKFGGQTPMKRPAQPEEIAPAFVFLAAPSCSSYVTGEILPIIGGYSGG